VKWKDDWERTKQNLIRWWNGEGPALCLVAPRDKPIEAIEQPDRPADHQAFWTDPSYRVQKAERQMANTWFAAEAFPYFDTQIGPGSLGTFIGAEPKFAPDTVWYEPCIEDPDTYGDITFEPTGNHWLDVHLALVEIGLERSNGRYLVGVPDLIENIDTLAAMRENQILLIDLIERPAWVSRCIEQINEAFFASFDLFYDRLSQMGFGPGNAFAAFRLWGPGKTAKVQCDFSCMISPAMFREFVVPSLKAQCDWLDYALYHLDGPDAIKHVDALLEIESLRAIQWQPGAGNANSGHAQWHDLLKRIKAGGKGVQVGCLPDQVIPLLDAIGPEGTFITCGAENMEQAQEIVERVEAYR